MWCLWMSILISKKPCVIWKSVHGLTGCPHEGQVPTSCYHETLSDGFIFGSPLDITIVADFQTPLDSWPVSMALGLQVQTCAQLWS